MSRTLGILLGLALVWLTAWVIAGTSMHRAGSEKLAVAEHLRSPATSLERGAEIRVEGVVVDAPPVTALYSEKPCLAALTTISIVSSYRDIHDRPAYDSSLIATRRVGPANIEIAVGDQRLELPLDRWAPRDSHSQGMSELPPRLGISREQIDRADAELHDGSKGYSVSESILDAGTHVFVAARIEDSPGALRLAADPVLGRVELFPGTREAFIEQMRGSGGGLRVAGWIVGAGVGPLPLAMIGLVLLVRRRRPAPRPAQETLRDHD